MAQYLRMCAKPSVVRCAIYTGFFIATTLPAAAELVDPTRPPETLTSSKAEGDANAVSGPTLQSVLISSKRREAIINGQTFKLGDVIGDARIVRIAENEVVLRKGSELQTLRLYPNIEKRTTHARNDITSKKQRQ